MAISRLEQVTLESMDPVGQERSDHHRTFLQAQQAAEHALAGARRTAEAVLADAEAKASVIEANARNVKTEILAKMRAAIEDASRQEQERLTAMVRDSYARMADVLDEFYDRLELESAREREARTDRPHANPSVGVSRRDKGNAGPTSSSLADEEFWNELRRALEDEIPLGPREDQDGTPQG